MKTLMHKKIIEAFNNKELLEVYTDKNNPNGFAVGFVVALSNNNVILNTIDSFGEDDGFLIIRIDDIYNVSYETNYLKNIALLCKQKKPRTLKQNMKECREDADMFSLFFKENRNDIITLKLYYDIDVSGIIIKNDEEVLEIKVINEYGNLDGISCIYITDIERISFESIEEKKLAKFLIKEK